MTPQVLECQGEREIGGGRKEKFLLERCQRHTESQLPRVRKSRLKFLGICKSVIKYSHYLKVKIYKVIIEEITLKIKAINTKTYYLLVNSVIFYQGLSVIPEPQKKA